MIDVIIDFKKWKFGKNSNFKMLSEDGCRCWLGFIGKACGVPDKALVGGQPNLEMSKLWPASLVDENNITEFLAIKISNHNDFISHPDGSLKEYKLEERIQNLIKFSEEAGFKVTINYEN